MAGDGLLVQYGLGAAVADRHLLAMIPEDESWLLADTTFGCATLQELAEPRDSSGLVRLPPSYEIIAAAPDGPPSTVEPVPVTVVKANVESGEVDAILLTGDDLPLLCLLLRGHPLADHAWISAGRDRHLFFAAGSLLQRLPVGEPLHRIGPGALYLPVGYRLEPAMPPSARGELFAADSERAVVLQSRQGWEFDVSVANREPVWTLWIGELPQIDWQVPDELGGVENEFRPKVRPRPDIRGLPSSRFPRLAASEMSKRQSIRTWRDTAWEHEAAGDLVGAAALFERHGDPARAAHLYEAAARADGSPRRRR